MTPRQRLTAARAAYVVIVLLATLTGLDVSADLATAASHLLRAVTPSLGWRDAIDGLRNVALFAGLGVVWVVTPVSGDVGRAVRQAAIAGLALSVVVELSQVFSAVRVTSIVDVATNAAGAAGGAVLTAVMIDVVRRSKGARSYLGLPSLVVAGGYGIATLCEALTPLFSSDLVPGVDGGPSYRLQVALQFALPLTWREVPWLDLVLFAPAGYFAVVWLNERPRRLPNAWILVAAAGAVLAAAAELFHGPFGLPIRWEAAALRAIAVALGALVASRSLAPLTQELRGSARAGAALIGYMALLVYWGWRPFQPRVSGARIAEQLTTGHLVPLASLSGRVDVFSALHVLQQFALYLPLGSLLAVWPLRLKGRWSNLWPAILLAVVIEIGHIAIDERFFDVTNALISVSGLAIGWIVVRRSGYAPYGEASPAGR